MNKLRAALALLALCSVAPTHALEMSDCVLKGARGYGTVNAQCGTWIRPENPDDPSSPTIELAVARIRALAPQPLPDAFTVINGGPGGSSIEMYADLARAFALKRARVLAGSYYHQTRRLDRAVRWGLEYLWRSFKSAGATPPTS